MREILQSVFPELVPLVRKRDLELQDAVYDERSFGNAYVDYSGPGFRIRATRDRGERWLDIARPGGDWKQAPAVLGARQVQDFATLVAMIDAEFDSIPKLLAS